MANTVTFRVDLSFDIELPRDKFDSDDPEGAAFEEVMTNVQILQGGLPVENIYVHDDGVQQVTEEGD
jgi:hypothetical protein